MLVAAALAVGAVVGVLATLTGIGGGALMVPFLYYLYDRVGIAPAQATVLAHATSLAVIVPTALRGLIAYRGSGLVRWRAALPLAVTAALTAALTAQLAPRVPERGLRIGFGVFLVAMAVDLLLRRGGREGAEAEGPVPVGRSVALGVPVGVLSAALGVGGGIPATMGMHYLLRMPLRIIAPTSLVVVAATGVSATASYLVQYAGSLPVGGIVGFVDFTHGLPLAVGAMAAAPAGVRLNRVLPAAALRRVFGGVLVLLGLLLVWRNL